MTHRDFNTISPSAKILLRLKARTDIPFAKEASAFIKDDTAEPTLSDNAHRAMFGYLLHFEQRYKTIDSLLKETSATNLLEISSGFSFRGLQLCTENESVYYIDTDLPDFIPLKKELVEQLKKDLSLTVKGTLDLQPLNVMQEEQFMQVADRFPPGPVTIVNEGLLMYLDETEKRQLCKTIHTILTKRGGCWITGDIYVKRQQEHQIPIADETPLAEFMQIHNIRDKMFDSFAAAESFFSSCGFTVSRKATFDANLLSGLNILRKQNLTIPDLSRAFQYRESWVLTV